jgi:hypothetical protein
MNMEPKVTLALPSYNKAQTIVDQVPADGKALYAESMRYVCGTAYGHACWLIGSPVEPVRLHQMNQTEFDGCYPVPRYICNQEFKRHCRMVRGRIWRFANRMIGRQPVASR